MRSCDGAEFVQEQPDRREPVVIGPALLDVGRDDYWTLTPACPGVLGLPFFA
jgi:hypothetical protein